MWEVEGAEYAEKLPEVIRLLTHASSTDEAVIGYRKTAASAR